MEYEGSYADYLAETEDCAEMTDEEMADVLARWEVAQEGRSEASAARNAFDY